MAFECALTNWIQSNWTGAHCAIHFVCHFRNVYFWDQFLLHTVKICFIVQMFRWRIYAYRKSRCALFQQNINSISVSFEAHGCAMFIDMYAQKPHFVPGCCFFFSWLIIMRFEHVQQIIYKDRIKWQNGINNVWRLRFYRYFMHQSNWCRFVWQTYQYVCIEKTHNMIYLNVK